MFVHFRSEFTNVYQPYLPCKEIQRSRFVRNPQGWSDYIFVGTFDLPPSLSIIIGRNNLDMQMDKVDRVRFLSRFVSGAIVMFIMLSLPLSVAQAGQGRGGTVYLDTDVVLTGKLMYSFTMAGQDISVVIGKFSMKIDGRKLLAENAVLWISEHRSNGRTLRDVEVYLEGGPNGNATIIEPDGTKTTDRVIFVIFHHKGRFEAEVSKRISKDCSSLPIVKRAISVRNKCKADSSPASKPEAILADSDRNRKTPKITTVPERRGALTTTKFAPSLISG